MGQEVKFLCGADPPLELVSEPQHLRTEPVWGGKLAARIEGVFIEQSNNYTGPSLNKIKRNVPQSNTTGPNNRNVVTVTVFGNLYKEKNTAAVAVLLPVLPTPRHISAQKQHVTCKKL